MFGQVVRTGCLAGGELIPSFVTAAAAAALVLDDAATAALLASLEPSAALPEREVRGSSRIYPTSTQQQRRGHRRSVDPSTVAFASISSNYLSDHTTVNMRPSQILRGGGGPKPGV